MKQNDKLVLLLHVVAVVQLAIILHVHLSSSFPDEEAFGEK